MTSKQKLFLSIWSETLVLSVLIILFCGAGVISVLFAIIGLVFLALSVIKSDGKNIVENVSQYICYLGGLFLVGLFNEIKDKKSLLDVIIKNSADVFLDDKPWAFIVTGLVVSIVISLIVKNRSGSSTRVFFRYLSALTAVICLELSLAGSIKLLLPLFFIAWVGASCDSLGERCLKVKNYQPFFDVEEDYHVEQKSFKDHSKLFFMIGVILILGEMVLGFPDRFNYYFIKNLNTVMNGYVIAFTLIIFFINILVLYSKSSNGITNDSLFDVNIIFSFAGLLIVLKSAVQLVSLYSFLVFGLYLIVMHVVSMIQVSGSSKEKIRIKGIDIPLACVANSMLGIIFSVLNIAIVFGYAIPAIIASSGLIIIFILMNLRKNGFIGSSLTIPCICAVILSSIFSLIILVNNVSYGAVFYLTILFGAFVSCIFLAVLGYNETKKTPQVKIYSVIITIVVVAAVLIVPFRNKTDISIPSLKNGNLVSFDSDILIECKLESNPESVRISYYWDEEDAIPSMRLIDTKELSSLNVDQNGVTEIPAQTGRLVIYTENLSGIKSLHSVWIFTDEDEIWDFSFQNF